jgi:translation initiation factor IF-3
MNKDQAIKLAQSRDLDLLVLSPEASPMVAKILDYSKYKFDKQKKLKEIQSNQTEIKLKGIQLSPTIDIGDFETRIKQGIKFLEHGDKVKISVFVKGRWEIKVDLIEAKINEYIEKIGEKIKIVVESRPQRLGKNFIAVISAAKK